MNTAQLIIQKRETIIQNYREDPIKLIDDLTHNISTFLSVEANFDTYSKYKRTFELDCKKALNSIFLALFEKDSPLLIFPDVIPGFTTVVCKKTNYFSAKENNKTQAKKKLNCIMDNDNENSMSILMNSFVENNNQMLMQLESNEIKMLLIPVNNLDKYFKDLEIYL